MRNIDTAMNRRRAGIALAIVAIAGGLILLAMRDAVGGVGVALGAVLLIFAFTHR
jgi:hypothetical protein